MYNMYMGYCDGVMYAYCDPINVSHLCESG